jgi:integrase/recombinase XerD
MLQEYFDSSSRIQTLRDSPLGVAFESLVRELSTARYARRTVRGYIWAVEHFVHWIDRQGVSIPSLDEACVDRFERHLRHCRCRRRRCSHRIEQIHCARMFLDHLRRTGLVTTAAVESENPVLLVAFRRWMHQQRGTCRRTLENYCLPILDFLTLHGEDPARFDARSLRQFVLQRRQRGEGAARTCANALRAFFQFLSSDGRCSRDLVAAIPIIAHWHLATLPRYLQPEEVERVITACDVLSPVGRRDRAVLLLLARLGLRASDVVQLRLEDINWEEAWIQVCGKSRRQIRLPLSQEVGDALAAYLQHGRPDTEAAAVIVRADAPFQALSHNTVSVIVDRALRRAGIVRPSRGAAHLLRHSFATSLLRQGAALQDIADVLRHRSVTTTEIYAKVDVTALQQIAQPWPGASSC